MGVVPLVWLLGLRSAGVRVAPAWWIVAAGFGCSWLGDWVAHMANPFAVGCLYLVGQVGLIGWALAPREQALTLLVLLVSSANFALLGLDLQTPDVLVHTIAWLGLLVVVWPLPLIPRLRWTLALAFGLGWIAWLGYALRPGWPTWLLYQGVRLAGIAGFCWASWQPFPWRVRA